MTQFSFSFSTGVLPLHRIIPMALLCILGLSVVHIIKLMRLYLIVMEQHISPKRFIPAYLRTTLVNLVIPYKLGEIYRIGVFSKITGSFYIGLFSILVDRFFDTMALILLLLPYQLLTGKEVSGVVLFLTAFLLFVAFSYIMFPPSYKYLNRYIIMNRTSNSSMMALRILEKLNEWFLYVKKLVSGRYGLIAIFSVCAWLLEMVELMLFGKMFNHDFGLSEFGDYISSILSESTSMIKTLYTVFSIVVVFIAFVIFTIIYLSDKKKEERNKAK